jgi:6-phosphogluconate dehydrogenase
MIEGEAHFGVIGMGVMGRNLALNMADNGHLVAVWNRGSDAVDASVRESGGRLIGARSPEELVDLLRKPRKILIMVKAGKPVEGVIERLKPLLDKGDILIDGGNTWFEDTIRREEMLKKEGIRFFGVGISGGEEGARHGPSLMPGGRREAYRELEPILSSIAAKTDSGSCVTYVGPNGAGHFVKMVHNGIEYADMQLIAEAYHLLKGPLGFSPPELHGIFAQWNRGRLQSFLIEITAEVFAKKDPDSKGWLIDRVLDKAGQKGTGRWTVQAALDLGVPVPSIAAAVDARILSSMWDERQQASELMGTQVSGDVAGEKEAMVSVLHDGLYAAKTIAYAQGLALIRAASSKYNWSVDLKEIARIWKGGCIIRARFLDTIMRAFEGNSGLSNMMLDEEFRGYLQTSRASLCKVIALAHEWGVPVPAMGASLAYYDSYRSPMLPQNLTQAQRDAFGAHTYQRNDRPDSEFVHSQWLTPPTTIKGS